MGLNYVIYVFLPSNHVEIQLNFVAIAFHLRMPKELRPFITLNDNRVIELDYKAHHPRMLYHMEGIDYREDPYEAVCDSPEDRKLFKFVQLVAVNAENDEKAVQAMRQVIRNNGLPYSIKDKDLYPLIEKFKKAHKPIEKYLTSGVGRTLQNIDSKITEYTLMTLKAKSIPALPVHDSYIVDERYEGVLAEIMNEGYEKYMGYQPVIDK